jgi:hypothetical protein
MRSLQLLKRAALLLALVGGHAAAQDSTAAAKPKLLKAPVFLLMPSWLTTCTWSCPAGKSRTDFNARFMTVIPTASPWFSLVGGVQWGWAKKDAHGPIGFFGGIIPIVPLNNATNGWLAFSLDPLGVTTGPGGTGTQFVGEGAVVLNVGAKMMKNMGIFSGLGAFFLVDQQLTHVGRDATGKRDYWNPALVYGVILPLAP